MNHKTYLIIFEYNIEQSKQFTYNNLPFTHCSWSPSSAFNTSMPPDVNKQVILYKNTSHTLDSLPHIPTAKTLCYCNRNISYDCYRDTIDSVYPEQIMTLQLYISLNYDVTNEYTGVIDVNAPKLLPLSACVVSRFVQIVKHHTCNTL